jgi:hypothetical protein
MVGITWYMFFVKGVCKLLIFVALTHIFFVGASAKITGKVKVNPQDHPRTFARNKPKISMWKSHGKPRKFCPWKLIVYNVPSVKHTTNYGNSPFLMGKSTILMAIFNSTLLNYQRVPWGSLGYYRLVYLDSTDDLGLETQFVSTQISNYVS